MILTMESIIRAASSKRDGPLNIILFTTNENYEHLLCNSDNHFYALNHRHKEWIHAIKPRPETYNETASLNVGIGYDAVLCLGRGVNYELCNNVSKELHIPIIIFEKNYPAPNTKIKKIKGHINIFLSEEQAAAWGFKPEECNIISLGVDRNLFYPIHNTETSLVALTAIDNWRQKDWSHGFRLYHKYKTFPAKIVGNNPGISESVHWKELIKLYQTSAVYFNPTIKSVIPLQILEAMACGCPVVSFDTGDIKNYVKDDYNGYLIPTSIPEEAVKKIELIIQNPDLRQRLSKGAIETETPDLRQSLNSVINKVRSTVYTGE